MLVLGRRKKVWSDPRSGVSENEEEVVIGEDVARVYLLRTALLEDRATANSRGTSDLIAGESAVIGMNVAGNTRLTRKSPEASRHFQMEFGTSVFNYQVRIYTDEALFLEHASFGEGGVTIVLARIVHATHVRFGFVADREVTIHRLEVFHRISRERSDPC